MLIRQRRSLTLTAWALFIGSCLLGCDSDIEAPLQPTLELGQTQIIGLRTDAQPQVSAFLGIPYAVAPIGDKRWRAPMALPLPEGPLLAQRFGAACTQTDYNADWYADVARAFGENARPVVTPAVSEDCLSLNIWTPNTKPEKNLPVMVWIHGGSNKAGWSFEPNYLGHNLAAQENVVVVSINYRLGVFGFFDYPSRAEGDTATNFALLDQIAALSWVSQHIGAFGGDKHNVTLFGESAGAADIGYLMASPAAGRLFHRAISQSGGFQLRNWEHLGSLSAMGQTLADQIDKPDADLDALRKVPAKQLLALQTSVLAGFDFRAQAGSTELPVTSGAFFRKAQVPVDLLIGTNANEWYMYNQDDAAAPELALEALPEPLRAPLRTRVSELDSRQAQDVISTLTEMTCPSYFMAAQTAASGKKAWVYRFARVRDNVGGASLLAYHGAEIPYVFNTHDAWMAADEKDGAITQAMMRYWANFARTGDPNDPSLPAWSPFSVDQKYVMQLDVQPVSIPAPDAALCASMDDVLWH